MLTTLKVAPLHAMNAYGAWIHTASLVLYRNTRETSAHAMATLVPENEPCNALKRRLGGKVTEVA